VPLCLTPPAPSRAAQVVQFGPSGASFAPPVTLRLPFSPDALADLRAAGLQPRLAAFRWDKSAGWWREVAGEVREVREGNAGVAEVESESFSFYTMGVPLLELAIRSGLACYSWGAPSHASFAARFSPRVPAGHPIEVEVNYAPAGPVGSAQRAPPGVRAAPRGLTRCGQVIAFPEGRRAAAQDGEGYRAVRLGKPLYKKERLTVQLRGPGVDEEQQLHWYDSEVSTYFNIDWPRDAVHGGAPLKLDARIFCEMPSQPQRQQLGSVPVNITPVVPGAEVAPIRIQFAKPGILAVMARLGSKVDTEQELQDIQSACISGNQHWSVEAHTKPKKETFQELLRGVKGRNVLVIHFSGHGAEHGDGLVFDGEELFDPKSFLKLMRSEFKQSMAFKHTIDCVFLNTCLQRGLAEALRTLGALWVVYWEGRVADATARAFAREFYRCLNTDGYEYDYCYAFERARDVVPGLERGEASPVLLAHNAAGDLHGWGDETLLAASSKWQQGRPTLVTEQGGAWGGGRTAESQDEAGGDVPRNWRAPRHGKDFSAWAGKSERLAMEQLGFAMVLPSGDKISEGNGIDRKTGLIDPAALAVFGVKSYLHVWGSSGAAVRKAKLKLSAGGSGAVEVTEAATHLQDAERYRSSDMSAHSNSAKACRGTCQPAVLCPSCKSKFSHQHALKQIQTCRVELQQLVQQHRASQGGAHGVPQQPGSGGSAT